MFAHFMKGVEASVDGVLGGYGHVNVIDIKGSEAFLKMLLSDRYADAGKKPPSCGFRYFIFPI